jgi:mono/diheme cytochrome c family protein
MLKGNIGRWRLAVLGLLLAAAPRVAAADRTGAEIYAQLCVRCHGASGRGDGPDGKALKVHPANHTDAKRMAKIPDDTLYDIISVGGYFFNRSPEMPAFGALLSDRERIDVVKHLRTLCRCRGPDWADAHY